MLKMSFENEILPEYSGYCLSGLPNTILSIFKIRTDRPRLPDQIFNGLDIDRFDKVVLLLLDGTGAITLQRERAIMKMLNRAGIYGEITSVFPSTTAAALTTILTGLTPQEHSLPEWYLYLKEVNEIVATLPFSTIGDQNRDSLINRANPRILFDGSTIFSKMKREGINVFSLLSKNIANSAYTSIAYRGSRIIPYGSLSELIIVLRNCIEKSRGGSFVFAYWASIDSISHKFGPDSEVSSLELSIVFNALKDGLIDKLDKAKANETLFIITSDHGQIPISPKDTVYLNKFKKLSNFLRIDDNGNAILPSGSARDVFLHIDKSKVDEAKIYLSSKLDGVARVLKSDELVDKGLFGIGNATKKFKDRIGDLIILPLANNTVWYIFPNTSPLDIKGHHGGLTKDEMLIPFFASRLSDLQV